MVKSDIRMTSMLVASVDVVVLAAAVVVVAAAVVVDVLLMGGVSSRSDVSSINSATLKTILLVYDAVQVILGNCFSHRQHSTQG